jgi:predicted ATP-grasp superfamily ATP-dependent carboligase
VNKEPKKGVVYVARDIERALGMEPGGYGWGEYAVVSNDTAYGREIRKRYPKHVFLVESPELADTYDLLRSPQTAEIISGRGADVIVFQNTPRIERLAKEKGWKILNPSADLAKTVEEKVSQAKWLGEDARFLPPFAISTLADVPFTGKRFVLQFNHAHTGQGTYIIDSAEKLRELQAIFPRRECRVADFVLGAAFTVNAAVSAGTVIGNLSYQITGMAPFTDLPFSTIGNDWALPRQAAFESLSRDGASIVQAVGARLEKSGWKGLFGVDLIYDTKAGKTYLIEINARQAASATFESKLQKLASANAPSLFELHVAALAGRGLPATPAADPKVTTEISGAQIVKRSTEKTYDVDVALLRAEGFDVIEYADAPAARGAAAEPAPNRELFRIQSTEGIMEAHDEFNDRGKYIASCIRPKL